MEEDMCRYNDGKKMANSEETTMGETNKHKDIDGKGETLKVKEANTPRQK